MIRNLKLAPTTTPWRVAALALLFLVIAVGVRPGAANATAVRNGQIVFGVPQIPEPVNVQDLTLGRDLDLFGASARGHDVRRLTEGPGDDHDPAWSPNGKNLAFARATVNSGSDLFVLNPTTDEVMPLTATPGFTERHPSWSPDGSKIAFSGGSVYYPYIHEIYVMDAYGYGSDMNAIQLTDAPGEQSDPAWSPDGRVIAYVDQSEVTNNPTAQTPTSALRLVTPDGESRGTLVPPGTVEYALISPSWSPDGSRLAFSAGPGRSHAVWVVNRDGSGLRQITPAGAFHGMPSWSPDGRWIAFLSDRSGPNEYFVYKMRPDGSDVSQVIDISLGAETINIAWGPRP